MKRPFSPPLSILLEIGILFLPAIPAYLWMWPNLKGTQNDIVQGIVYLYVLAGTLVIGLRRWTWDQLGINHKGIALTLTCGLAILAARLMIILSIDWPVRLASWSWSKWALHIFYYFALVGLVEELLFRGLLYRLLEDWHGVPLAVWGSSIGFGLWHILGQGPMMGFATVLIGLLFAQIRMRSGGIIGLIILHALWDLETVGLVADARAVINNPLAVDIRYPILMWLGTFLLLFIPIYLGLIHPRIGEIVHKKIRD